MFVPFQIRLKQDDFLMKTNAHMHFILGFNVIIASNLIVDDVGLQHCIQFKQFPFDVHLENISTIIVIVVIESECVKRSQEIVERNLISVDPEVMVQ